MHALISFPRKIWPVEIRNYKSHYICLTWQSYKAPIVLANYVYEDKAWDTLVKGLKFSVNNYLLDAAAQSFTWERWVLNSGVPDTRKYIGGIQGP